MLLPRSPRREARHPEPDRLLALPLTVPYSPDSVFRVFLRLRCWQLWSAPRRVFMRARSAWEPVAPREARPAARDYLVRHWERGRMVLPTTPS